MLCRLRRTEPGHPAGFVADKATVHRFDQPGVRGLKLNNPVVKEVILLMNSND
jgi:hypothetical protein